MFFQQVYDKSLAQASYVIGCQKAGVAAVIDPKRDVDTYLEIARQNNLSITHILETHIHADFLAGTRELAALTGAKMYLSDEGGAEWRYEFDHEGLKDGDVIMLGNLKIEVIYTPGHTPESISFLLTDTPATDAPVMFFTGDFVFVGDIGRPDLLEKAAGIKGSQDSGARQMFDSLKRFRLVPDFVQVWPGHGAGSACGKALGAVPSSTVGYELIRNWAFQFEDDEAGFANTLLSDQPEPPKYFAMMKKLNKSDRPLLTQVPRLEKLSIGEFKSYLDGGAQLVDARLKTEFAKGYIPGSLNIQGNNSFGTWAGWFLSYDRPIVLVAEEAKLDDLTRKLMRVGLDNIVGYIPSTAIWEEAGGRIDKVHTISLASFESQFQDENTTVIDLRSATEFKKGSIPAAKNVFIGTLPEHLNEIPRDSRVLIHCQSGDRAAIGYSFLASKGFSNIYNFSGGMNEWQLNGKPVIQSSDGVLA